ncbi:hypothetical protein, partial [Sulfurimonas sp.]|uniref:hypothetical protein n=1 Tax=Sulfurimonas sp. TaxID=2022749 RepID=UPI00262209E4
AEDTIDDVVHTPASDESTTDENTIDAVDEDTTAENTTDAVAEDTVDEDTTDAVAESTIDAVENVAASAEETTDEDTVDAQTIINGSSGDDTIAFDASATIHGLKVMIHC